MESMVISRRSFIGTAALFGAAAVTGRAQTKGSVVVLGAGLSGLSSAYELSKLGYDVTVIEARDRVGGRIKTLKEPFSDGLYTEVGGELIGDGYERFLKYADEFGIEAKELPETAETGGSVSEIQDGIGRNAYMRGKFYRRGDVWPEHPYKLKGDESNVLPPVLYGKYLRLIGRDLRNGKISMDQLDQLSIGAEMRRRGASKKAISLMNIALNYNSIKTASAAGVMSDVEKRRNAGVIPLQLETGNEELPKRMAEAAAKRGVQIELSSVVRAIDQSDSTVTVRYVDTKNREPKSITADRIVCTIPFSVLRRITFNPGLPRRKKAAVKSLSYTQVSKVFFQAKYAEWDRRALGSSVWTDTPIERIFSTTGKTGDERALFTVWTDGKGAMKLDGMPEPRRKSFAKKKFLEVLPFMKDQIERVHCLSWDEDPFAEGAYSHLRVNQYKGIYPDIGTSVGRIHFAGEHTAKEKPGMEGALESAERVVKEITG